MSFRTNFATVFAAGFLAVSPAFGQETNAGTVVATVNGTDITVGHMIVLRDALPEQYRTLPDDVLFDGILEQLIQQTILAEKADSENLAFTLKMENERRSLLAGKTIQGFVAEAVTDEALQAAYDKKFSDFEPSKEFNASHILVETESEADALILALEGGADFAELAMQMSTGPSGPNGGELGWFGPGMMVKPFEDVVVVMEVGAVSAPVETQFGWHVITLNETRNVDAPALDDVRAELTEEIQQSVIESTLAGLVEGAEVVQTDLEGFDKAVIKDVALIAD